MAINLPPLLRELASPCFVSFALAEKLEQGIERACMRTNCCSTCICLIIIPVLGKNLIRIKMLKNHTITIMDRSLILYNYYYEQIADGMLQCLPKSMLVAKWSECRPMHALIPGSRLVVHFATSCFFGFQSQNEKIYQILNSWLPFCHGSATWGSCHTSIHTRPIYMAIWQPPV
jgi:hypothetical protein